MEQTIQHSKPDPAGQLKNSNLAQAWLVLVLALVFGGALAGVEINLKGKIAANKLNETIEKVPELVWGKPEGDQSAGIDSGIEITPGMLTIEKEGRTSAYQLYRVTHLDKLSGWVIKAAGQGYADRIEILLGLDPEADTITGLFVLEQKETPGLGNKIIRPDWRNQFTGKQTGSPLIVGIGAGAGANIIDAITGATISSRSVTGIVNRTLDDIKDQLNPETILFKER